MRYIMLLLGIFLVGCSEQQVEHYDLSADQQLIQEVIKYVEADEKIEKAMIVAAEDDWLVTYQLKPLKKWSKKKHEKTVQEAIDTLIYPKKATISNDFKLYYESRKLNENKASLKNTKKKIKELKKLKEEQT